MVPRSGQKLRRGCRYDLLSRKLDRRNAQFFCRPLTEGPVFFVSLFYRHTVPAAPRVSPCATDIPPLRGWGKTTKPPNLGGHTAVLPTCRHRHTIFIFSSNPVRGAISVDTTRHPRIFKLRRSDISVTAGVNPATHAQNPIFDGHAPFYRYTVPTGLNTRTPSSLQTPLGVPYR